MKYQFGKYEVDLPNMIGDSINSAIIYSTMIDSNMQFRYSTRNTMVNILYKGNVLKSNFKLKISIIKKRHIGPSLNLNLSFFNNELSHIHMSGSGGIGHRLIIKEDFKDFQNIIMDELQNKLFKGEKL